MLTMEFLCLSHARDKTKNIFVKKKFFQANK